MASRNCRCSNFADRCCGAICLRLSLQNSVDINLRLWHSAHGDELRNQSTKYAFINRAVRCPPQLLAVNCPKQKADTTFTEDREPVNPEREAPFNDQMIGQTGSLRWHIDTSVAVGPDECESGHENGSGRCGKPLIVEIDRVVGRGRGGTDVVGSGSNMGSLINPNPLITNKILAPRACVLVDVSASSVDNVPNAPAASVTLLMNGRTIGSVSVPAGLASQQLDLSFWFDATYLRFGTRRMVDGQASRSDEAILPAPGQNRFEAVVTYAGGVPAAQTVSVFLKSVSFEAKSPILLQHGIQGCNDYFTKKFRYNGGSPVVDARVSRLLESIGAGYSFPGSTYAPLPVLGLSPCTLPNALAGPNIDPISLGGGLAHTIPGGGAFLASEINQTARSFGASTVHIIAHSKGGLWSRHALGYMQSIEYAAAGAAEPSPIMRSRRSPVIATITTIDTPHHGSAASDVNLFLYALQTRFKSSLIPNFGAIIRDIRMNKLPRNAEAFDLAPGAVQQFNSHQSALRRVVVDRHAKTVGTAFYSISADADVNQDGIFGVEDGFNMLGNYTPDIPSGGDSGIATDVLYSLMAFDRSGNPFSVLPCDSYGASNVNWNVLCTSGVPALGIAPKFAKNDLIVTRASARHPEFQELFGLWKNHSTAGECLRMAEAVRFILGSDPLAGGAPNSLTCPAQ